MAEHTFVTEEPLRARLPDRPQRSAISAGAVGALALGATALGALMIGRLVIGALAVSKAKFKRVEIDDLIVKRLHYKDRV
jgi:hypothetical protein